MAPARVVARIYARSEATETGCLLWVGADSGGGYGVIVWHEDRQPQRGLVHRLTYEAEYGEIPDGLVVDHKCHDPLVCTRTLDCPHRRCVNPRHLKAVTNKQNVLRSVSPIAMNAVKTHCAEGHPYDAANTYVAPNGWRQCRICRSERIREYRDRQLIRQ